MYQAISYKDKTSPAERYDAVCVEDLNLKDMSKGLHLGKGEQDNGYGQFLSMLGYKLEERGKDLIKVDRYICIQQDLQCKEEIHNGAIKFKKI